MNTRISVLLLSSILFLTSCGTKRHLSRTVSLPMPADTLRYQQPESNVDSLFRFTYPDHNRLQQLHKKQEPVVTPQRPKRPFVPSGVAPGTVIRKEYVDVSEQFHGVDRIGYYQITHRDIPQAFDGFRIVFASDLHYKSLFRKKELEGLVDAVNSQFPDLFLLGGDYQEGCEYVPELFEELSKIRSRYGTSAVMGNNDYERCHDQIIDEMKRHGMRPLEHQVDTIRMGKEQILIAGVRDPFDLKTNGVSPTLNLSPSDFVILLVHTPDYAEDVPVDNSDLVLAGHTHGGQVCILGYAPIVPSRYGRRFLTGLKYTTAMMPMIITNGLGTSQKKIRIGAPTEILVITLKAPKAKK